jgi:hypothetical protein
VLLLLLLCLLLQLQLCLPHICHLNTAADAEQWCTHPQRLQLAAARSSSSYWLLHC